MFEYNLHEIQIGHRHYLLLPRLNQAQVGMLGALLKERGFDVELGRLMNVRKHGATFHIDPVGVCWSTTDPADFIAPVIPKLLEARKEPILPRDLSSKYFRRVRRGALTAFRLSTRIETTPLWRSLRASGLCALAPDERAVAAFLIGLSDGCALVTDFPTRSSRVRMIGKRQYYESFLTPGDAGDTIRAAGEKGPRNSYLPTDGTLRFRTFRSPRTEDFQALSDRLGEWCYYAAQSSPRLAKDVK